MNRGNSLKILGLAENNLKSIDVEIPHNQFVVVTGLSGSGKSSLAFDTVYAEGQKRYIETFSTYVRQFLDRVKQPKLDSINSVRPAIAIEQHARIVNSRATVGSLSDVADYLRLLFTNLATLRCAACGIEIKQSSARDITELISMKLSRSPEQTFLLAAPILTTSGDLIGNIERLQALGFSRVFAQGELLRIEDAKDFSQLVNVRADGKQQIIIVIDRVRATSEKSQLTESVKQALSIGEGRVLLIDWHGDGKHLCTVQHNGSNHRGTNKLYTEYLLKPDCSAISNIPRPSPSLFSHNHPYGACPECKGFGAKLLPDVRKIVSNEALSLNSGAIACWHGETLIMERRRLRAFCEERGIDMEAPWHTLSVQNRESLLFGKGKSFLGVVPWLKRLEKKIYKMHVRVFLSKYRSEVVCEGCGGAKLRKDALSYNVDGLTISDLMALSLSKLSTWVDAQFLKFQGTKAFTRELSEVFLTLRARLKYLNNLQLSYLSLNRQARTLSGGEVQRVRLATALGSELVSTQFVLDEPSIGLHPRDTEKLLEAIIALTRKGNSVLVVEHDEECIRSADHVIALGPGAGKEGGQITYSGSATKFKLLPMPEVKRAPRVKATEQIAVKNARARNLKNISFKLPTNRLICLTGVSGSGKSTIVDEIIKPAWERYVQGFPAQAIGESQEIFGEVDGFQFIDSLEIVDQSALAKSPRANIGTYTGLWERMRNLLAGTNAALENKLSASSFSFNTKGGRCTVCEGAGRIKEEMQFLSDVYLPCEACGGKRFTAQVLSIRLNGLNAAELLALTVDEVHAMFSGNIFISSICEVLIKLGLGHLSIGHSLSDLSGGEAQRLKLVPYIEKSSSTAKKALLIFDEPTTGLHTLDIHRLLNVFEELISLGHTVLCVEHNLSVIHNADHIIDIGPEGGEGGGDLIVQGPPSTVAKCLGSFTGHYLSKTHAPRGSNLKMDDSSADYLEILGAKEHNLKNIDIKVPLNTFVAITGVSGSGKSTLAKDIIFAEGQRRYLDCLSRTPGSLYRSCRSPTSLIFGA